jgi:hypothetical protein
LPQDAGSQPASFAAAQAPLGRSTEEPAQFARGF